MSSPRTTTKIRVSTRTRGRLAAQARERGVSVAALLAELAPSAEHEAAFRAEREATRTDAASPAVRDEDHDWCDAAGDGFG